MVLIIDSWKGSENLINNGVLISNRGGGEGREGAGKIGIIYKVKNTQHEMQELYSLYLPWYDNRHTINDGWHIIIIAIHRYLFTYLQPFGTTRANDCGYTRISETDVQWKETRI